MGVGEDADTRQHVASAADIERWFGRCKEFAAQEGVPYFIFGLSLPRPDGKLIQLGLTTYPDPWLIDYEARGYMQIDPVAQRMRESVAPFCWGDLDAVGAEVVAFWERARHFGMEHGYSMSLNGSRRQHAGLGLGGIAGPLPTTERQGRFERGLLFAAQLFDDMLRAHAQESGGAVHAALTPMQREVLTMVAQGRTIKEIAKLRTLHPRTVEYHLRGSLAQMGAKSREQAIVRAFLVGEIEALKYPVSLSDPE